MCHTVWVPVMSSASAQKLRLKTIWPRGSRGALPVFSGVASRSRGRIITNQMTTQSRPKAPTTTKAERHEPTSLVSSSFITWGVMMAPTEAPLCSTLLPIVRSFSFSMAKVVFSAQGQCPASKKPSSVRQISRPE